jgi:hypothetical protein
MLELTERELVIIQDQEFLLTKASALAKVYKILSTTREELKKIVENSRLIPEQRSAFKTSKISRGESYMGLPYQVLDYPAFFSKNYTFAYRTMFWWGNFFSATLHLEGQFLEHFRKQILQRLDELVEMDLFICVGATPWEYHYGKDNYQPLSIDHQKHIESCSFLKLSRKQSLENWKQLPEFSCQLLKQLNGILLPV